ncbi:MAG TPA: TonB family protein [Candidatus Paceibacterota bacterium]|nr:TonB family protein [Candidatus Paceibacterota bacterium]
MNRLQKKCVIVTAGLHLLLIVILFVGPAFFNPRPKADDTPVLDVIPANLIDEALNSGVKGAQPPPPVPQPVVQPQPQQQPAPPTPKPVVQPAPQPTLVQRVEKYFAPEPKPDLKPVETPEKNPPHKIEVNTQLVTRDAPKNLKPAKTRNDSRAIQRALESLRHNLSSATEIEMPGNSSASYASYASAVKSVYERTLIPLLPDAIASDNENTKVSVTIASDGTVISARIISPSGDPVWDAVVQRTLDRVTYIAPFPEGATEKERTYTINFNPQVERTLQ